ncbi:MAG: hypothetical protein U5L76_03125 [Patescibacteria group bacterium]|nr:hypothetical protein [Patescibacteria group bacterium]
MTCFTIFSKVSLAGDPCHQSGDKIGGKKTGIAKEDGWGIIGQTNITNNIEFTPGSIIEITGQGIEKKIKKVENPKKEENNTYRFVGLDVRKFNNGEKTPVITVIPLSLER